jgi:alkylated DNA repair dioxygenase AlkB
MSAMTTKPESSTVPPVMFYPDYLSTAKREQWFARSKELAWARGEISMYGRKIAVPREETLFGDDLKYQYRGALIKAEPWPDFLLDARERIEALCDLQFHFAVGNRYIDGRDSIGWHSDNFPQIGPRPPVASLSLGATRRFKLRHKVSKHVVDYELASGSLLIMLPGCQEAWEHAVPKTSRPVGERINWTFRPHVDALAR